MTGKNIRVIFDTNVWISFLIGKRLSSVVKYISDGQIVIIITEQLLNEIKVVTSRERMKKYFPDESVLELIGLLETIAERVEIKPTYFISRDAKDNFLLDLIHYSDADYLVTGDQDLVVLNQFESATILTPADFERVLGAD